MPVSDVTQLELTAVLFSLASVILAARRHVGTWPAGIVAVTAYFVVFVHTRLYADAALQVVFLAQGVYGWAHWTRRGSVAGPAGHITTLRVRERAALVLAVAGGAFAIGTGLARYTDAASPFLDATVSVLSLAANWLLARRVLDNWALWVVADVLYVGLFLSKGLTTSAALYVVFLVLALAGWRAWHRALRSEPAARREARLSPAPRAGVSAETAA